MEEMLCVTSVFARCCIDVIRHSNMVTVGCMLRLYCKTLFRTVLLLINTFAIPLFVCLRVCLSRSQGA